MSRFLGRRLYGADFKSGSEQTPATYEQVTAREVGFQETWLQGAIAANPDLVIDPCVEAGLTDESWWLWEREVSTDAGSIDVLLVSETGRVAIVETKLSYNPGKRRSVLAQVLDYAVSLPELDASSYPALPEGAGIVLHEVERRVQEGDFLLIVAGDRLDSRAVRLGRALLGDHLVSQWELALVEVAVYAPVDDNAEGPHMLVPHLRGSIEKELRQVVKVEVDAQGRSKVAVEHIRPPDAAREKWDETRFFEELQGGNLPRPFKEFGQSLKALSDEFPGPSLSWGTGKNGSATLKRNGQQLVEFYLDGSLGFRIGRPRIAVGRSAGEAYVSALGGVVSGHCRTGTSGVSAAQSGDEAVEAHRASASSPEQCGHLARIKLEGTP